MRCAAGVSNGLEALALCVLRTYRLGDHPRQLLPNDLVHSLGIADTLKLRGTLLTRSRLFHATRLPALPIVEAKRESPALIALLVD